MPLLRSRVVPLAGLLCAAVALAPRPAAALHPTNRCVGDKLKAAGRLCHQAVLAEAARAFDPQRAASADRKLDRAGSRFAGDWLRFETESLGAGVDCAESTATSAAVRALARAGAVGVAAALGAGLDAGNAAEARCALRLARQLSRECAALLGAEARDVLQRPPRGTRRSEGRALACVDEGTLAAARDAAADAARSLAGAATISPNVPSAWTMYVPDAQVAYRGRTYEPICSRGTPYVFFARRGTTNDLLVYYQGGGACWNYLTCEAFPVFSDTASASDNPANSPSGLNDLDNPANPFRDWNMVFVPYCTGDVHWGDATFTHTEGSNSVVIHHRGFVNAQVVEKWTREHFVNPDRVFVSGSSAGAYGAIVNSLYLQEDVYPNAEVFVLGDAGNGVITPAFLQNDISKWGLQQNLPPWIPALNVPLTQLDAADLWVESALFYPQGRFATYTTAYDGGLGGQTGFFNIMLNPGNIAAWLSWWNGSCLWNQEMRRLNADAASRAPNYRFYVGSGSRHTIWGNPKVYTDTTGGVPPLAQWIGDMLDGSDAQWQSVECSDCGVLLPGDPAPSPPEPPFTAGGRIVCP